MTDLVRRMLDGDRLALARLITRVENRASDVPEIMRAVHARTGKNSPAGALVDALRARSREFAGIWDEHPVVGPYCEPKRLRHPELGILELYGQTLLDPDQFQTLIVFTAHPGSESYEKLQLLPAVGARRGETINGLADGP